MFSFLPKTLARLRSGGYANKETEQRLMTYPPSPAVPCSILHKSTSESGHMYSICTQVGMKALDCAASYMHTLHTVKGGFPSFSSNERWPQLLCLLDLEVTSHLPHCISFQICFVHDYAAPSMHCWVYLKSAFNLVLIFSSVPSHMC